MLPLIGIIIDALIDGTLIAACFVWAMGLLGVLGVLGALGFVLKAIVEIVKVFRGVPYKVIKRRYINHDGREVIEEIPYSPAMNMFNATTSTLKEITDGRSQH